RVPRTQTPAVGSPSGLSTVSRGLSWYSWRHLHLPTRKLLAYLKTVVSPSYRSFPVSLVNSADLATLRSLWWGLKSWDHLLWAPSGEINSPKLGFALVVVHI